MYCSNCGVQMSEGAAICVSCGFAKGAGTNFCQSCGAQANPGAVACVKCGCALGKGAGAVGEKSKTVAGLLYIILGAIGVGDFYLGYTTRGIIKLLVSVFTAGIGAVAVWIWSIIDGIKCLQGEKKDAHGLSLKE